MSQQSTYTLERLVYGARVEIPPALADAMVERVEDFVTKRLVFQLRAAIYAQRLDEQVVRYPADWWEAFKQRFAPRWALKRWPVRETVKTMRLYAWYPEKLLPGERSQFLIDIRDGGLGSPEQEGP